MDPQGGLSVSKQRGMRGILRERLSRREKEKPNQKKTGRKENSEPLVLSDISLCSHNVCFLSLRFCFEFKQAWATIIGSSHLV